MKTLQHWKLNEENIRLAQDTNAGWGKLMLNVADQCFLPSLQCCTTCGLKSFIKPLDFNEANLMLGVESFKTFILHFFVWFHMFHIWSKVLSLRCKNFARSLNFKAVSGGFAAFTNNSSTFSLCNNQAGIYISDYLSNSGLFDFSKCTKHSLNAILRSIHLAESDWTASIVAWG